MGQPTESAIQESPSIAGQGSNFQPVHDNFHTEGSAAVQCNLPHSRLHERLKKAVQSLSIPYNHLFILFHAVSTPANTPIYCSLLVSTYFPLSLFFLNTSISSLDNLWASLRLIYN